MMNYKDAIERLPLGRRDREKRVCREQTRPRRSPVTKVIVVLPLIFYLVCVARGGRKTSLQERASGVEEITTSGRSRAARS
jgi:hypothetical protein